MDTSAHTQQVTHTYVVNYPEHEPRTTDPNYKDFNHIREQWKNDPDKWQCIIGKHRNDFSECDLTNPLELHHSHIEFSLQNGIDLKWLETDYPGISDPNTVGAWVESANNLMVLCRSHHRSYGGVHNATASDFEAEKYVKNLIKEII